jgi:hypothetical protein
MIAAEVIEVDDSDEEPHRDDKANKTGFCSEVIELTDSDSNSVIDLTL